MKKVILSLVLIFSLLKSFSQVTSNAIVVGGNLNFEKQNSLSILNSTSFSVNPYAGFFLSNHFMLGVRSIFSSTTYNNGSNAREIGLGILSRYYPIHKAKILPYLQFGLQRINYRYKTDDSNNPFSKDYSNVAAVASGVNLFINQHIALEGSFEYNFITSDRALDKKKSLAIKFGFQIFLNNNIQ